jgi:phosphoglycerate dehydrogenase-like enzyme
MMKRIAVLDDYWHVADELVDWSQVNDAEIDIYYDTILDEDALIDRLKPYHAVVTTRERTRFPSSVLSRLPNLELIAGTGARQANVNLEAAVKNDVLVCITTGSRGRGNSTAELAWALVLAVTRNVPWEDRQMREGNWQTRTAESLGGKTLGILGMGRLGTIVAGYGNAFDMDVIAWGPTLDAERAASHNVEYVKRDELFRRSDILSIHVPLTDLSRGWIGNHEFGLMKPSAYLVNTSRGPIVQEEALINALSENHIAGAALDVYDVEPLPKDHPLTRLDNVVLSPHLGYATMDTLKDFFEKSIENLNAWIAGAPINLLTED